MGAEKARFVLMGILMVPLILVLTAEKLFPGLEELAIGAEAPVIIAVLAFIVVVSFIALLILLLNESESFICYLTTLKQPVQNANIQ